MAVSQGWSHEVVNGFDRPEENIERLASPFSDRTAKMPLNRQQEQASGKSDGGI
jgi:hypothetical protein